MRIKVSDYIFQFLESKNIDTAFSVSGGAAAHLLESIRKSNIKYIPNYHEQASAMSAEGYTRITNKPALVLVTNGPGSSNTLTGVIGAYQDSIPMFIISGQVPTSQTSTSEIRQLGVQELRIIPIVKNFTNYATQVKNPKQIKYILELAWEACMEDRRGPVWLDIPLDVQNAYVETDDLVDYRSPSINNIEQPYNFDEINDLIAKSKRPLIITGNGIHLSNTETKFKELIHKLQIPAISTWTSKDLFDYNDKLFVGTFGLLGERAGNFAVQKADLLIILGSRLSIPNIGYNSKLFSPNSTKIMVDVDYKEMDKKTLDIDYKIEADLSDFLPKFVDNVSVKPQWEDWINETQEWKNKYQVFNEPKEPTTKINSFHFIEQLSKHLKDNHVVVTDMGTSYTCTHQALRTNGKNRLYTSSGTCSMGFGLPGAIGTHFGDKDRDVILVTGDGGLQMNIQELQTVVQNKIPLKMFVLNNNGYLAISLMQDNLFDSKYIGSTPDSGVSSPDFCAIGSAYGIKTVRLSNNKELDLQIQSVLDYEGAIICEIMMPEHQLLIPRVQSRKDEDGNIISTSIENMFPFLPDEEIKSIMS